MKFSKDDYNHLLELIELGYVRRSYHPRIPDLQIYTYTPKAEYGEVWDKYPLVRQCRGLVLDTSTREVVIPCVEKFFNAGTKFAPTLDLPNCDITEKADGYLIQIVNNPKYDEIIITSKGSFDSKYVEFVRKYLKEHEMDNLVPNIVYICELLHDFPGDEGIIVTRHPETELLLWAIKDADTGEEYPLELEEIGPFKAVKHFDFSEAKQYITGKVEGVVAHDWNTGQRVKIKTKWFFKMHKLISDCTEKRVLEILIEGKRVEDLDIPDEFMKQMLSWQDNFLAQYHYYANTAMNYYATFDKLSDKALGELAGSALPSNFATMVFMIRKGKKEQLKSFIWRCVKNKFKEEE